MNGRKHPSNIGIRRQHTTPRQDLSNTISHVCIFSWKEHDTNIFSQHNVGHEASKLHTIDQAPSKSTKARLQSLKRQELFRSNYEAYEEKHQDDVQSLDHKSNGLTAVQYNDSDEGSPPILLINPDFEVLPVAKTEQAKGAFDFCKCPDHPVWVVELLISR